MKTLRQSINDIKKIFPKAKFEIKIGFHYLTGFITLEDNKILYVSSDDERFNPKYRQQILFRTAKDNKDYTGGRNNFFNLDSSNLNQEVIIKSLYGGLI